MVDIKRKKKHNSIVISNRLNESQFKMSKLDQKLFFYCITHQDLESKGFSDEGMQFTIKEFANMLGVTSDNIYRDLRNITKRFLTNVVEVYKPEEDKLIQMNVTRQVQYMYGEGTLNIVLNESIKPYLVNLKKNFTQYSLQETLSFKSAYSMRIYQLINQYAYRGEVEYSIDDLKFILNIGENTYKHYGLFKRKTLKVAKTEIEAKTAIRFHYEEIKQGRKVVAIRIVITEAPKREPVEEVEDRFVLDEPETKDIFTDYTEEQPPQSFQDIKKGSKQPTFIPKIVSTKQVSVYSPFEERLHLLGLEPNLVRDLIYRWSEEYLTYILDTTGVEDNTGVTNKAGYFLSIIDQYQQSYQVHKKKIEEAEQALKEWEEKERNEQEVVASQERSQNQEFTQWCEENPIKLSQTLSDARRRFPGFKSVEFTTNPRTASEKSLFGLVMSNWSI